MGLVSDLVCEYDLPIPFDDFGEDEETDFKEVKWDEMIFYTSSFFDPSGGHYRISHYTISEDGQFYKNDVELEFVKNEDGELETKEKDMGIERQDFTGEIYFGTETFGEDHDYMMTFKALFYKGELKEMELDEWTKKGNKERKKLSDNLHKKFKEQSQKVNTLWYQITYPVKWIALRVLDIIGWFVAKTFNGLVRLRNWIVS